MDTAGAMTLDEGQLDSLRAALVRIREENEADLASARATLAQLTDDHTLGSGSLREVAANAEYMIEDASAILAMVDAALSRMDAGNYGLCTSCGSPIAVERLELRPQVPTWSRTPLAVVSESALASEISNPSISSIERRKTSLDGPSMLSTSLGVVDSSVMRNRVVGSRAPPAFRLARAGAVAGEA